MYLWQSTFRHFVINKNIIYYTKRWMGYWIWLLTVRQKCKVSNDDDDAAYTYIATTTTTALLLCAACCIALLGLQNKLNQKYSCAFEHLRIFIYFYWHFCQCNDHTILAEWEMIKIHIFPIVFCACTTVFILCPFFVCAKAAALCAYIELSSMLLHPKSFFAVQGVC